MVEIATMLEQMIRKNPYNKNELQRRLNEIEEAFANNTEPKRGKCLVCGAKTNSAMSGIDINYCGPCWNSGKAKEHIEKEKEKPLTLITPEELMEIVKIGQEIYEKKNTEEKEEPVCLVTKDEHGRVTVTGSGVTPKAIWDKVPLTAEEHLELKSLREEMDKMRIQSSAIYNPDPRCDGCEYQHPFMENMSIDTYLNRTYCNRGLHPAYYKDGKTIQYDPALKLCHKVHNNPSDYAPENPSENYKHDDSQIPVKSKEKNIQAIKDALAKDPGKIFPSYIPVVGEADHNRRPIEFNPPCAEYCIPEVEKIMEREVSNHRAILNILDMLRYHGMRCDSMLLKDAESLKAKLAGEK
jgi:hypothetical protein